MGHATPKKVSKPVTSKLVGLFYLNCRPTFLRTSTPPHKVLGTRVNSCHLSELTDSLILNCLPKVPLFFRGLNCSPEVPLLSPFLFLL